MSTSLPELHNHAEDLWSIPEDKEWKYNITSSLMALLMNSLNMRAEASLYENPNTKMEEFNNSFYAAMSTAINKSRSLKEWFAQIKEQGRSHIMGHEVRAATDLATEIHMDLGEARSIYREMNSYAASNSLKRPTFSIDDDNFKAAQSHAYSFINEFNNHDGYDCERTDYYNNAPAL